MTSGITSLSQFSPQSRNHLRILEQSWLASAVPPYTRTSHKWCLAAEARFRRDFNHHRSYPSEPERDQSWSTEMHAVITAALFILMTSAVAAVPRQEVKIGVIAPLAGSSRAIGDETVRTLNLIAEQGRVKPGKFSYQFVFEDGKGAVDSSPTTALHKLRNVDGVRFFIVATSGEILQVGPLAKRLDALMIATYATVPDIKTLGDRVFRTAIDVERGVDFLGTFIEKKGDLPLALLTEQHTFTSGVSDQLRRRFPNQIVADESYLLDDADLHAILLRARGKQPRAYYLSCARPNTCAQITNQARQLGITEQLYSFLHMSDPDFLSATPGSSEGFLFLAPPDITSRSQQFAEFQQRYKEKYNGPPRIEFLLRSTYDAAQAIISGIESVGISPSAVSNYLKTYKASGALGPISFDANGDVENLNYVVKTITDQSIQAY